MGESDPINTAAALAAELLMLLEIADASGFAMAAIHIDSAIVALLGTSAEGGGEG
jgi:hypothetical protein